MRFIIFTFLFLFTATSLADDISDFEIEGISVGESLLNFYTLEEINKKINSYNDKGFMYPSNEFYAITFKNSENFLTFDDVQFSLKNNDKSFE